MPPCLIGARVPSRRGCGCSSGGEAALFAEMFNIVEPGVAVFGNRRCFVSWVKTSNKPIPVFICPLPWFLLAFFLADLSSGGSVGWMVQYPLS